MVRRSIVMLAWAGSWLGCNFDPTPTGFAGCVDGQSAECACQGGARGLQTCADGEYGECMCGLGSGSSAAAGGGDDGSSASTDGPGAGGSSAGNSAGSGAAESPSGNAGSSGHSAEAGGGGAGNAGTGNAGTGAAGGAGSSAGGAGDGLAGAGNGGAAGLAGGVGGHAGKGGDPGDPAAPPGSLYGSCANQAGCADGLVCYTSSLDGTVAGYCAPLCTVSGSGTGLGPCEQPASGKVRAQCAPLVGLCLLGSCQSSDCPSGMSCVETAFGQAGSAFDCRFPVH